MYCCSRVLRLQIAFGLSDLIISLHFSKLWEYRIVKYDKRQATLSAYRTTFLYKSFNTYTLKTILVFIYLKPNMPDQSKQRKTVHKPENKPNGPELKGLNCMDLKNIKFRCDKHKQKRSRWIYSQASFAGGKCLLSRA